MAVTVNEAIGTPRRRQAHDFDLDLPRHARSVGQVRHVLDALLASLHVSVDCRQRIAIAVTEACANAVQHAYGTDQYHLAARVDERHCQVSVTDDGCGFRPVPGQLIPRPVSAESGRGLPLIAALADQFELYTHPGQGTQVRLSMDLVPADGA
jgi:serine/threonine-protein kinase RsbW